MEKKVYSIKELESITGIKAHTIRIWEKRYNLLNPVRTDTNLRRYTEDDIKKIVSISVLYNYGWKISKIAELDIDLLNSYCEDAINKQIGSYAEMAELMLAIRDFKPDKFDRLLRGHFRNFDDVKVCMSIIAPLTYRLNLLSLTNRIDKVIEEYFLNKLLFTIMEKSANFKNKIVPQSKSILILQSDNLTIPVVPAVVRHYALTKAYSVFMYSNVVKNSYLKRVNEVFNPDFVYSEFAQPTSDDIFNKRIKAINKEFKDSTIIISGRKAELLSKKLPENILFLKNLVEITKIV